MRHILGRSWLGCKEGLPLLERSEIRAWRMILLILGGVTSRMPGATLASVGQNQASWPRRAFKRGRGASAAPPR